MPRFSSQGAQKGPKRQWLLESIVTFGMLLLLYPNVSAGEERTITLDEAYGLAIASHEAVRAAEEGVFRAESNIDKATSALLPKVTVEGTYTKYTEKKTSGTFLIQPDDTTNVEVRLTQPIYTGGKEWTVRRQAYINLDSTRTGLDDAKEGIILSTARAYYGVLKAVKDLEIQTAALKRAEERRKVAEARLKVGEVTRSAVLRAEAEVAGIEAELVKAERGLIEAKDLLKRITGVVEEFSVAEPPRGGGSVGDVETLLREAYERRKDYREALLAERFASEGINYARGNFLPSLKLEGAYQWRDQNPQTTFFQRDTASGSLILSYPIFEGGLRKAELSEAKSVFRETELRRLSLKRDIEIEVRRVYNNIDKASAVIEAYKRQVDFAEEDYKMVFEQFKWGLATTVDVIDADTTLVSAQSSYVSSVYDLEVALLELRRSVGTLLDSVTAKKTDNINQK